MKNQNQNQCRDIIMQVDITPIAVRKRSERDATKQVDMMVGIAVYFLRSCQM